ncbi:MAG: glycosyltransferase family 1 protein [Deltaproteobacteria bacterium]|nr:MAG: glycosyltransferase family 1 protein [Deltaproteobacteria bacterium]
MVEKNRHDTLKSVVVHIITKLELGGAQENTLINCEKLDRGRYEVFLVSGDGGILNGRAEESLGERFIIVPSLVREINPLRDFQALLSLTALLRRIKGEFPGQPLIVHTHSSKAGILGRIAARLAGCHIIIHTVHGFGFTPLQSFLTRRFFIFLEKFVSRFTDAFVLVSEANGREGIDLGIFDGEKTVLIRSGFDVERFASGEKARGREIIGCDDGRYTVGMVACFKPQKNPLDFVRMAGFLREKGYDFQYVLVGDGELRPAIAAEIVRLGLGDSFHLTGWVEEVEHVMAAFDVLVLTSLWEGLPRVIPQALALGIPVVVTNVDGNPEVVEEGKTGYVVPPRNPQKAAEAVERVYRGEIDREALLRARERVRREFSQEMMVERHERLYDRLLRSRGYRVE